MDNLAKLAEIFPECITEIKDINGKILKRAVNFEKLKLILSDNEIDIAVKECYKFTWPGKAKALSAANKS